MRKRWGSREADMVDCLMVSGIRWVALGVGYPFMRGCNGDTECLRAVESVCLWLRRSWQTLKIEGDTHTAVHEAIVTFLSLSPLFTRSSVGRDAQTQIY